MSGALALMADAVDDTQEVAARLRILRRALDMSQAQICRETGISPGSWNNAETGDNKLSMQQALKLFNRFRIDPTYIYMGYLGLMLLQPGPTRALAEKIEALTPKR